MKKVCILGAGPSLLSLLECDISDVDDVILINNHTRTCQMLEFVNILKDKNIYITCNSSDNKWEGFNPVVFSKLNVKKCLTNMLKPDIELWRQAKEKQKKHHDGGSMNNLGFLPILAEDEAYIDKWRGPEGRNLEKMYTFDNRLIEHMPDSIEQYLIPPFKDNLIVNQSYFASLYAAVELQADSIIYFGLDFYNTFSFKKSWYVNPPTYGTSEWWKARMAYEGEHMKVLYDDYFTKFFPYISLEFFTLLQHTFKNSRITCNTITIDNPEIANQTWYSSGRS
jgi:hypothetical protein